MFLLLLSVLTLLFLLREYMIAVPGIGDFRTFLHNL